VHAISKGLCNGLPMDYEVSRSRFKGLSIFAFIRACNGLQSRKQFTAWHWITL